MVSIFFFFFGFLLLELIAWDVWFEKRNNIWVVFLLGKL